MANYTIEDLTNASRLSRYDQDNGLATALFRTVEDNIDNGIVQELLGVFVNNIGKEGKTDAEIVNLHSKLSQDLAFYKIEAKPDLETQELHGNQEGKNEYKISDADGWLSDANIDVLLKGLKKDAKVKIAGAAPLSSSESFDFSMIKKDFESDQNLERYILPLNTGSSHWVMACVTKETADEPRSVLLYNPIGGFADANKELLTKGLAEAFGINKDTIETKDVSASHQSGEESLFSCGYRVVEAAKLLANPDTDPLGVTSDGISTAFNAAYPNADKDSLVRAFSGQLKDIESRGMVQTRAEAAQQTGSEQVGSEQAGGDLAAITDKQKAMVAKIKSIEKELKRLPKNQATNNELALLNMISDGAGGGILGELNNMLNDINFDTNTDTVLTMFNLLGGALKILTVVPALEIYKAYGANSQIDKQIKGLKKDYEELKNDLREAGFDVGGNAIQGLGAEVGLSDASGLSDDPHEGVPEVDLSNAVREDRAAAGSRDAAGLSYAAADLSDGAGSSDAAGFSDDVIAAASAATPQYTTVTYLPDDAPLPPVIQDSNPPPLPPVIQDPTPDSTPPPLPPVIPGSTIER